MLDCFQLVLELLQGFTFIMRKLGRAGNTGSLLFFSLDMVNSFSTLHHKASNKDVEYFLLMIGYKYAIYKNLGVCVVRERTQVAVVVMKKCCWEI